MPLKEVVDEIERSAICQESNLADEDSDLDLDALFSGKPQKTSSPKTAAEGLVTNDDSSNSGRSKLDSSENSSGLALSFDSLTLSPGDSECKYKISIYSKASGCRMTHLPDALILKQIRVTILEKVVGGDVSSVRNVSFAFEKMKNGGLQVVSPEPNLIVALSDLKYFAGIPCKMTHPDTPRVVGFIKDVPYDKDPAQLKDAIRKTIPEVYSVRYVSEKNLAENNRRKKPSAFVSFDLRVLPESVKMFGMNYLLQVPNPMQCTRCSKFGHQGKQCRAKPRCSICSLGHEKHRCMATYAYCVNCGGPHPSTSHECSLWKQGKLMNELRYRGGLTAEDAINIASEGKITHKKHLFFKPEFFELQDQFYVGANSTYSSSGALEEILPVEDEYPFVHRKIKPSHPKFMELQNFLDLKTDMYLKMVHPDKDYTHADLIQNLKDSRTRKSNSIAKEFKENVLKALVNSDDGENDLTK